VEVRVGGINFEPGDFATAATSEVRGESGLAGSGSPVDDGGGARAQGGVENVKETRTRERRCEKRGRDFIEDKLHSIVPVLLMMFGHAAPNKREACRSCYEFKTDALRNS
jgi:hypothetical protein